MLPRVAGRTEDPRNRFARLDVVNGSGDRADHHVTRLRRLSIDDEIVVTPAHGAERMVPDDLRRSASRFDPMVPPPLHSSLTV